MDIEKHLRIVADFPKKGIQFYDIATLIAHPEAWRATLDALEKRVSAHRPDMLAAIESRGFLVGAPLAARLGCGMLMVRKKGKLPGRVQSHSYALEYGQDTIEVQEGIVPRGARVVVMDDLVATGGTLRAAVNILRKIDSQVVAAAAIIELSNLGARDHLGIPLEALLSLKG